MVSEQLAQAIHLRATGHYPEARQLLDSLYEANPEDPEVNYQLAWLCDVQEQESEAVPYYERAIANGLTGADLRGALLGLGSTYRCLGKIDKAITTLTIGLTAFPNAGEFPVFLAMALHNAGRHSEAMIWLLAVIADTSDDDGIQRYRKAIRFYHDKLDKVWK